MSDARKTWKSQQVLHLKVLLAILAVLWLCTLFGYLFPSVDLTQYGILPRQASGLWGILVAPFIHADWAHLAANTLPFLILGWLTMLRGMRVFVIVAVLATLVCGLGVWALGDWGASDVHAHIGASGVIFGLFGYLLLRAYFERSLGALLVACGVGFFYGGLTWGFLPLEKDVSWLGHVFGFAGGVLAAWALSPSEKQSRRESALGGTVSRGNAPSDAPKDRVSKDIAAPAD
ncbi:MAG: rhomboid family intramembrane serine protease [Pirellulales bacterium]|nr:rhomboid family intramembrane serine protease [Pirellulales bacterium]